MAGVKQFDEQTVLDKATRVFWEKGFEGTSIQDLVAATGLHRGSLYGAFGDKEQLFLRGMDHYNEQVAGPLIDALDHVDPRVALARFFGETLARLEDAQLPPGCLNTNTATAMPTCPARVQRALRESVEAMERALYQMLLRSQRHGYLAAGEDLQALAHYIICINHGLAVMNRRGLGAAVLRDVVATALEVVAAKVPNLPF